MKLYPMQILFLRLTEEMNFLLKSHDRKIFENCFVPNMNILAILRILIKIDLYTKTRLLHFVTKAFFLTVIISSDDSEMTPVS